jgi:hypothetical protein
MRRLSRVLVVVGLSLVTTLGVGCKQALNERCEQDSDCEDGLQCRPEGVSAEGGRCVNSSTVVPDAATELDAGSSDNDAGTDAGDDAGGTDSGGADAPDDGPMTSDATGSDASGDMSSTPTDASAD